MTSEPILHALFICDHVLQDADGKWSCIGIFNKITPPYEPSPDKPWLHPRLGIFVALGETFGEYDIHVQVVHLNTLRAIGEWQSKAKSPMWGAVQSGLSIDNFPVPFSGKYELRVVVNGQEIGSRTFTVEPRGT